VRGFHLTFSDETAAHASFILQLSEARWQIKNQSVKGKIFPGESNCLISLPQPGLQY
jgi:hypothetical protein